MDDLSQSSALSIYDTATQPEGQRKDRGGGDSGARHAAPTTERGGGARARRGGRGVIAVGRVHSGAS